MIDRDAIELIQETAVNAGPRIVLPPPGAEPPNVYFTTDNDGNLNRFEGVRLDRHAALDIDTVVRLAAAKDGTEVWYSKEAVIAAHPDGDRATFALQISRPLELLAEWDKQGGRSFTQIELFRTLRTQFRDALGGQFGPTLAVIKSVDIKTEQVATGVASRSVVSMGKSVMAEVRGPELPDVLRFYVPVFRNPAIRMTAAVTVAFDLDPEKGLFTLVPLPGEIEAAYAVGEAALLTLIQEAKAAHEAEAPVYYGKPG